ncbi:MAG: SpoIIIAH-like family protein [Eubacterium sp.]|nr:SpoIIIAH-like family protein [Eubacterium sp.]
MKKVFQKNQVVVTVLAILIAVAGYLKYTYENPEALQTAKQANQSLYEKVYGEDASKEKGDLESLEEPTVEPGAAVLTNQTEFTNYMMQAKLEKEQLRSQNMEQLQSIIENEQLSEKEKQKAVDSVVEMKKQMEMENNITELLKAKGYENILVTISGQQADVILPDSELNDNAKIQIENVVKRKTGYDAEQIIITPAKE